MGQIDIEDSNNIEASLIVPKDASGTTLHILLVLRDDGSPQLTRYRRLVIECK